MCSSASERSAEILPRVAGEGDHEVVEGAAAARRPRPTPPPSLRATSPVPLRFTGEELIDGALPTTNNLHHVFMRR